MSDLENFILPVTYNNGNSYTFSRTLEMFISFSADAGAIPLHYSRVYKDNPKFIFNNSTEAVDYKLLKKDLADIDRQEHITEDDIVDYLEKFVDIENEPLLDTNFKFTLPYAFKHSKVKDISFKKVSPGFRSAKWMGLLESCLDDTYSPIINSISYRSKSHEIDFFINEKIDNPINLHNSSNYLQTIIETVAEMHSESLDINSAVEFFNNKPYQLILLAIEHGVNTVIENGYNLYYASVTENFQCEVEHKPDTVFVPIRRMFNWDYDRAVTGYVETCDGVGIIPNFTLYEHWHNNMFSGNISTYESATVNTIAKLIRGQEFTDDKLSYFERTILDYAAVEKFESTGSELFKKWLSER